MRNTLLLQLPGVRKICLYYIAAPVLLLCLLIGTACPAYAEETADSSSSSTSDTTDDDLSLGGDITDAYEWSFVAVPAQRAAGVVKRFGQGEGSLKAMVRACGSRAQVRELEELEKLSALGKSYLGALRREVRRLMLVADETLDGAVAESVTEKLGERELLELKKAFGARAAKKLGTNVQIVDPREKREENERDFCV